MNLFDVTPVDGVYDLAGEVLSLTDNFCCEEKCKFINGTINCNEGAFIVVSGADTEAVFGEGLVITSDNTAIKVEKRGSAIIEGAEIGSKDDAAITVTGFSLAKENSSLLVKSGMINSGSDAAIKVEKGGSLIVEGGVISSTGDYAVIVDGPRSKADIQDNAININGVNGAEILSAEPLFDDIPQVEAIVEEKQESVVAEGTADDTPDEEVEAAEPEIETKVEDPVEEKAEVEVEKKAEAKVENPESAVISKVLSKPTFVYGAPSTKKCIATIVGAIKILGPATNNFTKISFKAPGSNKTFIGYIKGVR